MKILHVVEPFSSGITTFIISITQELPHHEHVVLHGDRVTVDKLDSVRSRFPEYVKFRRWKYAVRPIHPIYDFLAFITLLSHLLSNKYDVIHLHSAKAGFLGRMVGFFFAGKKMVYTPNGAPFLRRDVSELKRSLFRFLERLGNFLGGKVICCGKSESKVYIELGVENIYINNGVSVKKGITEKRNKTIKIVSTGILTFQKNPVEFSEIAQNFQKDPRVEFIWIGDGPLRPEMDSDSVKITGWKNSSEVQEYLVNADIYLSTSLWEGQPFAVLEAMNNSCCLLLNRCVGNIDLVDHGINGYLFDETEEAIAHIDKLLKDAESITEFGHASRVRCNKEHDQIIMGKSYEQQYFKIGSQ